MRGSPAQVAVALRIAVPRNIALHTNEFVFEVTAQTHATLVKNTPVDTGYLVNSLSVTAMGESLPTVAERDANARAGQYAAGVFDGMAIPRALAAGKSLLLAFQAKYATYVEDSRHMVKRTKVAVAGIVRDAVKKVRSRHR